MTRGQRRAERSVTLPGSVAYMLEQKRIVTRKTVAKEIADAIEQEVKIRHATTGLAFDGPTKRIERDAAKRAAELARGIGEQNEPSPSHARDNTRPRFSRRRAAVVPGGRAGWPWGPGGH